MGAQLGERQSFKTRETFTNQIKITIIYQFANLHIKLRLIAAGPEGGKMFS